MKSAVILFPGSNREGDAARALEQATGQKPAIVWHGETALPAGVDLVVLPGGFSYGDYLRCGAIAARSNVMAAVRALPPLSMEAVNAAARLELPQIGCSNPRHVMNSPAG